MKLAIIRRQFSATGGAELYLQRLLAALSGRGHSMTLFTEHWPDPPSGVTVRVMQGGARRAARAAKFAEAVESAVAREKFDCVFSLERGLRQDVYRAGDGVHRVWLQRRREFAPRWRRLFIGRGAFHRSMLALEARAFSPANTRFVIANSRMVAEEIVANFGYPRERIHLVRNGVDVGRFESGDRARGRERFGIRPDEFVILFVGSGWERKGLHYLLRALRGLPRDGCRLLVVGKGRAPRDAGSNVLFAGAMSDVETAYAAADLFVTLPIYEPSANVVVEALAAGLPVVTTAQNGAAELIAGGERGDVVARPDDTEAVIAAINRWRSARTRPPRMSRDDLSLDRNVRETLDVLELATTGAR
jgi:UDP-glucose:(heptosyl)LPS alpha-1,3-glucosyltransferase